MKRLSWILPAVTLVISATAFAQSLRLDTSLAKPFDRSSLLHRIDLQDANIEEFGLARSKKIALTFDDGPGAGTAKVLALLKQYNIKATFFTVGTMVVNNPRFTQQIVDEGHILANHSYDHAELSLGKYTEQPELLYQELRQTHELLKPYLRDGQNMYFRAPYGAWTEGHGEYLNQDPELRQYVGPVYWDIGKGIERDEAGRLANAGDWACWRKARGLPMAQCLEGYMAKIRSTGGGVVLLHDIHVKTADMLEMMLPILVREGYQFITLDQIPVLNQYRHRNILPLRSGGNRI